MPSSTTGWNDLQTEFIRSLKQPDLPVPDTIGKTDNQPSVKRFNVYRNNSAVAIAEALQASFPVVSQLVGDEFFSGMASIYMQTDLPKTPVMMLYGRNFPEFIAAFEPAQSIPYLADMATLEWYWTQAYNAADEHPVGLEKLAEIPQEEMSEIHLTLHPSFYPIKSEWPILSIWSAHNEENTSEILEQLELKPEQGFLVRPEFEVNVIATDLAFHNFIENLASGKTLGDAIEQLPPEHLEDLSGYLQLLFNSGAVIGLIK